MAVCYVSDIIRLFLDWVRCIPHPPWGGARGEATVAGVPPTYPKISINPTWGPMEHAYISIAYTIFIM